MHVNYRYALDICRREREKNPSLTVLDYGCGAGQMVAAGREAGFDIFGADIFQGGDHYRKQAQERGLLGTVVREIKDGRLDFLDATFDLILSNQVFEHVQDMEAVLAEIERVLKPGGKMVALFPSKDVWREGHVGIPFLHWFSKSPRFRTTYAMALHSMGIGTNGKGLPPRQAAENDINYLDQFCFYRPRKIVKTLLRKYFSIHFIEYDYIRFRLQTSHLKYLTPLVEFPLTRPLANELFRKLGGLVILAVKEGTAQQS